MTPATMRGIMMGVVGIAIEPHYAEIQTNLYKPNYWQ